MRKTPLDTKWDELMALCKYEAEFRKRQQHAKLLKLLGSQIARLGQELGFAEGQIQQREFRAVKHNGHVVRVLIRRAPPVS